MDIARISRSRNSVCRENLEPHFSRNAERRAPPHVLLSVGPLCHPWVQTWLATRPTIHLHLTRGFCYPSDKSRRAAKCMAA